MSEPSGRVQHEGRPPSVAAWAEPESAGCPSPTSLTLIGVSRERELVQALAVPDTSGRAMRKLIGGVNARELRSVRVTDAALEALIAGVTDPNRRVRWYAVQLLDHPRRVRDRRDCDGARRCRAPSPTERRACARCKPDWDGALDADIKDKLASLAEADPNQKVHAAKLKRPWAEAKVDMTGREAAGYAFSSSCPSGQ